MAGLGILSQNVEVSPNRIGFNRGGGARTAGAIGGGIIGGIFGGPAGAAIGAQVGNTIVGTIQNWWRSKKDEEKKATPQGESLRSALADTITRGSFRDAAQITYYVNNTYSLGFMIPDSAQMSRVVNILQKEGLKFDKNINAK
jgi:hypothetical protein